MTEPTSDGRRPGDETGETRQLRFDLQERLRAAQAFERIAVGREVVSKRLIRQSRALIEEARLILRSHGPG